MTVWYLTADLMFSSRVVSYAERAGHSVVMAPSPTMLADRLKQSSGEAPALVIVDLTLPGLQVEQVVPSLRAAAPTAKLLAYGPHVYTEQLAAAQVAGCDVVMTNGQFDRSMAELLRPDAG